MSAWTGTLVAAKHTDVPSPMQTVQFLHDAFAKALPMIHARRLEALMASVAALLQGRRLTLTALGRSMPGSSWPRHAIKRIDRLLGNRHLQAERGLFYRAMLLYGLPPGLPVKRFVDDRGTTASVYPAFDGAPFAPSHDEYPLMCA
ncbi:hypothetical protein GCM10027398_19780 [Azotobacter salinestris]